MNNLLNVTLLGLAFGTIGTTIGGIIGICLKTTSNKFLSIILEFAAGLMMAVVCFELIPESLEYAGIVNTFIGVFLGIVCIIIFEEIINKNYINREKYEGILKTGIIIAIGLAIHNFPEGIAIGSGFGASIKLGISLAIAIALHDVPEGISMSISMKAGGMGNSKVLILTILSGVTTGVGALLGGILGNISHYFIGICLAFASGCMLYIISGELIPESKKLYKGRMAVIGNILGFLVGIIVKLI